MASKSPIFSIQLLFNFAKLKISHPPKGSWARVEESGIIVSKHVHESEWIKRERSLQAEERYLFISRHIQSFSKIHLIEPPESDRIQSTYVLTFRHYHHFASLYDVLPSSYKSSSYHLSESHYTLIPFVSYSVLFRALDSRRWTSYSTSIIN